VLENGLTIDAQWYIERQLSGPLLRIFDPIVTNASQKLFTGDHTLKIVNVGGGVASASNSEGAGTAAKPTSVFGAATVARKCLGCKTTLKGDTPNGVSLCKYCIKDKGPEIYFDKLGEVREKQVEYQKLWTECQRCQDSLHQEVICANCDCPIFYKRAKAKIDLQKVECQLKSLNLEW